MTTYKQKIIQHLGIVAGICNEVNLIQIIDSEINKAINKTMMMPVTSTTTRSTAIMTCSATAP